MAAAGTAKLLSGYNPATWMLEVTGGAMATLTPANASVDWPATYLASQLCQANATKAEALIEQVSCRILQSWQPVQLVASLRAAEHGRAVQCKQSGRNSRSIWVFVELLSDVCAVPTGASYIFPTRLHNSAKTSSRSTQLTSSSGLSDRASAAVQEAAAGVHSQAHTGLLAHACLQPAAAADDSCLRNRELRELLVPAWLLFE
jgi:hypothetical protein